MFDCIIVVISRSIEIMVVPLYESAWVGMECGVSVFWVRVVMVCSLCVWLWFLGTHLFNTCFVVKRVLWFWAIREIWVIYIVVLIKVMRWLLLSGCDSWFLSWCCKLILGGWVWWCFGVICLWSWLGTVSWLRICSGVDTLGVRSLCSCWLVFCGWLGSVG